MSCLFSLGFFILMSSPRTMNMYCFLTVEESDTLPWNWHLKNTVCWIFFYWTLVLLIQEKPIGNLDTTPEILGKWSSLFFQTRRNLWENENTLLFYSYSFYVFSVDLASVGWNLYGLLVWWVKRSECWSQLHNFVESYLIFLCCNFIYCAD